jgi:hypothetical protein
MWSLISAPPTRLQTSVRYRAACVLRWVLSTAVRHGGNPGELKWFDLETKERRFADLPLCLAEEVPGFPFTGSMKLL